MYLPSIGMPRRARLRAFFGALRSENFEFFRGNKNLQSEDACDRAEIRAARRRLALPRGKQVPNVFAEHRIQCRSVRDCVLFFLVRCGPSSTCLKSREL